MDEQFRRGPGERAEEAVARERRGDVGEEAARARAIKTGAVPSDKEVEERNLGHAAFRSWRPHRVKRRAESYGRVKKAQDEGEVPKVVVDYTRTRSEQEKEEEKGTPIVVAKDNKTKTIMARIAPSNEAESYGVETVDMMVERLGYRKLIMRSDDEPAILALKEAVRRESHVEIVLYKVPVGDHQADGLLANAIENGQGQFRMIRDALESRHGRRVGGEHQVAPRMVTHAASVVNRVGKTRRDSVPTGGGRGESFKSQWQSS